MTKKGKALAGIGKERGAKGCFKFGCFGCLVLIALFFGIPALLALVGLMVGTPEPNYEPVASYQPLPQAEGTEDLEQRQQSLEQPGGGQVPAGGPALVGPEADPGRLGGVDRPGGATGLETLEGGRESRHLDLGPSLSRAPAGTVRVFLEMGEFTIEPGPAGQGIRLEGDYDEASFDLEELYEQDPNGEWTYRVSLKSNRSWLSFFGGSQENHNSLRLILPRDHPMAVEGTLKAGTSDVDLGGLDLTGVDLNLKMGEHDLRFSEPTARPLERIVVDSAWGEIDVESLGNGSPKEVLFEGVGGEFDFDLRGEWAGDSRVEVSFKLGELDIELPTNARVVLDSSSMTLGERNISGLGGEDSLPPEAPTLHLAVQGSLGELRVDR